MPYLPDDLVQRMTSSLHDEQAAVAEADDRKQLVIMLHRSLQPSLQLHLDQGLYKTMQWLQTHKAVVVKFPDNRRAFANINSDLDLSDLS